MSLEHGKPAEPLVAFLQRAADGTPFLSGSRCEACGQIFVGMRHICARCCTRGRMQPVQLAEKGKVYAFTIVHRSFPGVPTPFIDVIVDLDDGAHLKGTLAGVAPELNAIAFDMPVRIAYRDVMPPGCDGKVYLGYEFVPC